MRKPKWLRRLLGEKQGKRERSPYDPPQTPAMITREWAARQRALVERHIEDVLAHGNPETQARLEDLRRKNGEVFDDLDAAILRRDAAFAARDEALQNLAAAKAGAEQVKRDIAVAVLTLNDAYLIEVEEGAYIDTVNFVFGFSTGVAHLGDDDGRTVQEMTFGEGNMVCDKVGGRNSYRVRGVPSHAVPPVSADEIVSGRVRVWVDAYTTVNEFGSPTVKIGGQVEQAEFDFANWFVTFEKDFDDLAD